MMNLDEYPAHLAQLEQDISELSVKIRNEIYQRDIAEADIDLRMSALPKDDYPNAEARKAWASQEKRGEAFMTIQRRVDSLNDRRNDVERDHRQARREWKVAQIMAQKWLTQRRFQHDDTNPEEPYYEPVDEPDERADETAGAYVGQDRTYDQNSSLEPDDDLPF